jgi:serine/threonine protein kinase
MDNMQESTGLILDNRYQLQELLGEGGSGSTYRAIRLSDQAIVAIKVLSLRHLNDWKQLELFEREAQILARLDHPQIPKYLEYFHVDTPTDRAFYIVQQLAPGQPLNALVQSGWRGTEAEIKSIASQILEILKYLQSQSPPLIHRDIKPHNIVRDENGQVFLVDFGAVQATYHNTLMKGNTVAGTYGYMAPEQFRGRAVPASDLYGLGATVLYLLTHRSPADLPQERLKVNFRSHVNLSESFADWLETMLEPDEADRFPSAHRAVQALTNNRYRRAKPTTKNAFPWRGAIATLLLSACGLSIFHQYRYTFLTLVGLQPSDLCQSITRGESQLLDEYLRHGGNANVSVTTDGKGYTQDSGSLLHCAVAAKQLGITQKLIQKGADRQSKDSKGQSALHRLVNDLPTASTILTPSERDLFQVLAKHPDLLNAPNHNNETPLFLAVRQRKIAAAKQLLTLGANPQAKSSSGANMFHALAWDDRSARNNSSGTMPNQVYRDLFQLLLDHQIDINESNNYGERPIHTAIQSYNPSILQLLIERGADIHARTKAGRTPLMVAIEKANTSAINLLLAKGARVNDRDNEGLTSSILLVQRSNWYEKDHSGYLSKVASSLFAKGANPSLGDSLGRSPLHWLVLSALKNHPTLYWENQCAHRSTRSIQPLISLWLKQGAKQSDVDIAGQTALHLAASKTALDAKKKGIAATNSNETVQRLTVMRTILFKQLVAAGWDPLLPDKEGNSPLQLLANTYQLPPAMTEQLVRNGKNINAVDSEGNTILHRLLSHYQFSLNRVQIEKAISMLVGLGANLDIKNKAGQTPLDLARTMSNKMSKESKAYDLRAYLNQCKIEVDRQRQAAKP